MLIVDMLIASGTFYGKFGDLSLGFLSCFVWEVPIDLFGASKDLSTWRVLGGCRFLPAVVSRLVARDENLARVVSQLRAQSSMGVELPTWVAPLPC